MARKSYEREKRRAKWGGGPFVPLARDFKDSLLLKSLTPFGCKLLFDLLSQYNGCNNGDLCITWSLMQPRGWSGKSTLEKAQKELIDCGLLVLSRQGGRNRPNLYALSLFSVDECKGKLEEIRPSESPAKQWQQTEIRLRASLQKTQSLTRHSGQHQADSPAQKGTCG